MRYLLDTHLLLWAGIDPDSLSDTADQIIRDDSSEFFFSVVSVWEVAIKFVKHRGTFIFEPAELRSLLLSHRYQELELTGSHVLATTALPLLHRDPFDRVLLAQAIAENMTLLTTDDILTRYPANVLDVR